jgi:hypothetical protein
LKDWPGYTGLGTGQGLEYWEWLCSEGQERLRVAAWTPHIPASAALIPSCQPAPLLSLRERALTFAITQPPETALRNANRWRCSPARILPVASQSCSTGPGRSNPSLPSPRAVPRPTQLQALQTLPFLQFQLIPASGPGEVICLGLGCSPLGSVHGSLVLIRSGWNILS